jgi:phage/plasmid-associated DNA primase
MESGLSDILANITGDYRNRGEGGGGIELNPSQLGELKPADGEQFSPITRTAVTIAQAGCFPRDGKEFTVYNFRDPSDAGDDSDAAYGTWEDVPYDEFKIKASILHAQLQGQSFDDLQSLTSRQLEHLVTKIACYNGARKFYPNPEKSIREKYDLSKGYIPFNNGVYVFSTKELVPHEKDWHLISKIKHDYVPPSEENPPVNFLQMIDNLSGGKPEVKRVLLAAALISMSGRHRSQQTSILHLYSSQGGTGKSTYIDCLNSIAGQTRTSTLTIKELTDASSIYPIRSSSLVVFPDEREPLVVSKHGGILLKMATADEITGRVAYARTPYSFRCRAMIIMASNTAVLPPTDSGLNRRALVIVVPPITGKKDFNMGTKLEEETPQIIGYLLSQFSSVEEASGVFRDAKDTLTFNAFALEVTGQSSNIALFVDSLWDVIPDKLYDPNDPYQNPTVRTVYETYRAWLVDNNPGATCMSRQKFVEAMRTQCADFHGKMDLGPSSKSHDGWNSPHAQRFMGLKPQLRSQDLTPAVQAILSKEYSL